MANPFTAQGLMQPQTWRGRSASPGGFGMDIANRNAAQARQAQMQEEFKEVMASQDPKQVAAFSFKYPEAAQQAQQSFGIASQETQRLATTGYGKALQSNDPMKAADQLDAYADMVEAAGGTPVNMRGDAESLRSGDLSMNQLELGVAMAEPDLWDRFNKARVAQAKEQPVPMTEYQREMIKGANADRDVRKLEAENKKIENQLKQETNQVKLDALKVKAEENKDKQFQIKKGRSDAAQSVVDSGESTLSLVDEIVNHPGFESAIGAKGISSLYGAFDEPISGTEAAGVAALIETLEAQNFLTAIGEFKSAGGAGALSDNEGKKLSAALSNLKRSQSEKDFKKSLNVIKNLVNKQVSRAKGQIDRELTPALDGSTSPEDVDLSKLSLEELKEMRGKL